MTNTLAITQPVSMREVELSKSMGQLAYESGIFKAPKAAAAAMIMLKGYELGFPMTAAAEFIQIIEGTVGLTPRGALAIMHNHPEIIRSIDFTDLEKDGKYYGCRCDIVRIVNGKDKKYSKTFTLDDAEKAQLIKPNSGWDKYPAQMCQWRALGFAADIACPDLLAGMTGLLKQPEVIEESSYADFAGEPVIIEPAAEPAAEVTLSDLLAKYDPQSIIDANGGSMPRTNAECAAIDAKLESGLS